MKQLVRWSTFDEHQKVQGEPDVKEAGEELCIGLMVRWVAFQLVIHLRRGAMTRRPTRKGMKRSSTVKEDNKAILI